jgi:hypothetical protein
MAPREENEQALDVVIKHLHIFRLWKVVETCTVSSITLKVLSDLLDWGSRPKALFLEAAMEPRN